MNETVGMFFYGRRWWVPRWLWHALSESYPLTTVGLWNGSRVHYKDGKLYVRTEDLGISVMLSVRTNEDVEAFSGEWPK